MAGKSENNYQAIYCFFITHFSLTHTFPRSLLNALHLLLVTLNFLPPLRASTLAETLGTFIASSVNVRTLAREKNIHEHYSSLRLTAIYSHRSKFPLAYPVHYDL